MSQTPSMLALALGYGIRRARFALRLVDQPSLGDRSCVVIRRCSSDHSISMPDLGALDIADPHRGSGTSRLGPNQVDLVGVSEHAG